MPSLTFLHKESPQRHSFLCSHFLQDSRSFLQAPMNITPSIAVNFSVTPEYWRCVHALHLCRTKQTPNSLHCTPVGCPQPCPNLLSPRPHRHPNKKKFSSPVYRILHPLCVCKAGLRILFPPHSALRFKYRVREKLSFPFVHQGKQHLKKKEWNRKSDFLQDPWASREFSASHYLTIRSLTEAAVLADAAGNACAVLNGAQTHTRCLCHLHSTFHAYSLQKKENKRRKLEIWAALGCQTLFFKSMYQDPHYHQFLLLFFFHSPSVAQSKCLISEHLPHPCEGCLRGQL